MKAVIDPIVNVARCRSARSSVDRGVEAVAEHERHRHQHGHGQVRDQARDVEQGRDSEHDVCRREARPVAVRLGVEDDVSVRVHRALRRPRGPRRVRQERDVVGIESDGVEAVPREAPAQIQQVVRVQRSPTPDIRQQRRHRVAEEIELGRRDGDANAGAGQHRRRHIVIQGFEADERRRLRVAENERELAFLQHRVDGNHDAADLPDRQHRHGKLRHVLEVHGDPLATLDPELVEGRGEAVAEDRDLVQRQRPVEVVDQRPRRSTAE